MALMYKIDKFETGHLLHPHLHGRQIFPDDEKTKKLILLRQYKQCRETINNLFGLAMAMKDTLFNNQF